MGTFDRTEKIVPGQSAHNNVLGLSSNLVMISVKRHGSGVFQIYFLPSDRLVQLYLREDGDGLTALQVRGRICCSSF